MERLSTEAERLQWRRNKVLELSSEGRSQPQIASILQVGLGTVNRDLQYLKRLAKANISRYISETLPLEYQKCMVGLDAILVKSWDIANANIRGMSERDKLQALSIGMEAYRMKLELLTNATVVERAVHFVEKHAQVLIDHQEHDTAKPIENTG